MSSVLCLASVFAPDELTLAPVFSDHAVLQRDVPLPIWGRATPGSSISVSLAGHDGSATTGGDGRWRVDLPALAAGGPHQLTVGDGVGSARTIEDVWVGEVWLCSGQSNMEWELKLAADGDAEVSAADVPGLHLLRVPRGSSAQPLENVPLQWTPCTPESAAWFSAVGYVFGRRLHEELGVPVGLVMSAVGGTFIEPWTPPEGFAAVPARSEVLVSQAALRDAHRDDLVPRLPGLQRWIGESRAALESGSALPERPTLPDHPLAGEDQPSALYNAMIHPLAPFAFAGVTWYQGEQDVGDGPLYTHKTEALLAGLREVFEKPELPLFFVQIAPFRYPRDPFDLSELREAQRAALRFSHTGMVVTTDVGALDDIHPKDKRTVGERLARLALHDVYGRLDVVPAGPLVRSVTRRDDGSLEVAFDWASGLATRHGGAPQGFEVLSADGLWVPATARLEGERVVLSSAATAGPLEAVRYGWHQESQTDLVNDAGLPASPFRETVR
ncbi:MAG: sialate O-acetylesterase [Pseudohongiellaceae bacterium]|jgi:sialate O-acetylesterase